MKISALLNRLSPRRIEGSPDTVITGLYHDSRKVTAGGAFFALRGATTDGHRFIDDALGRGARAVFMEEERSLPPGAVGIVVDDARQAMGKVAAAFYGHPTAGMPVVGVTGTNGKTTVTYLLESILRAAGKNPAVLGTINYRFGDRQIPAPHTTPESVDLFQFFSEFRRLGATSVVMEVSSHALDQQRVEEVPFDVGIFTNLTPEHLDFHGDMENYFSSKRRFFTELLAATGGSAVINIDDPYGERLAAELPRALTCGGAERALIHPRQMTVSLAGIEGVVDTPAGPFPLRSRLLGNFNLQNLLCAAGAGLALNIPPEVVAEGLARAPQVPGRLERIENDREALILVDYAHTGDALEKVLTTLRDLAPRRLIAVFGCGGDRDRSKRPVMGEVGARLSDLAILTSDNPRTEDPLAILEEVRAGALRVCPSEWSTAEASSREDKGFTVIPDREEAIALAVAVLRPGDLLLVAGKGHEDYQIIGRERLPFDDREQLRRALARGEETS
jgi:UDP-N-acetylmuramoyl-L-alanyl-D-glutamate--2,6-diaminopimelate ligase